MSSWNQGSLRKKIRLGYYQETPAGKFSKEPRNATVVSAFYEMPSKYQDGSYQPWIRYFLENCDCNLVFFTEENLVPFIEDCRKGYEEKTHVIALPRTEWIATTAFPVSFWNTQRTIDPEALIHKSSDLYKVWYEKKEFVKRAIQLNPFESEVFVWADAGICRHPELAALLKEFPHTERIPLDKIMLYNIGRFTERDDVIVKINGVPIQGGASGKLRISGGVVAGGISAWKAYDEAYEQVVTKYIQANLFLGKEQNIMTTLVLENRQIVSLLEPNPAAPEEWPYMALYLGCPTTTFQTLMNKKTSFTKVSYAELLRTV